MRREDKILYEKNQEHTDHWKHVKISLQTIITIAHTNIIQQEET